MQYVLRSRKWLILFLLLAGVAVNSGAGTQEKNAGAGGQLLVNADEAECVLAIAARNAAKQKIEETDWQRLFASEPYIRLKKREAEISVRFDAPDLVFADEQFKEFVLGAELAKSVPGLRRTLREWQTADMGAIAGRLLEYLPAGAAIKAKVYPVVKPRINSFVYELDTDPAIFLYLDPQVGRDKFENTLAHELHHIGFASVESRLNKPSAAASAELKAALNWLGAFGEGNVVKLDGGQRLAAPTSIPSATAMSRTGPAGGRTWPISTTTWGSWTNSFSISSEAAWRARRRSMRPAPPFSAPRGPGTRSATRWHSWSKSMKAGPR
jgi:hypothetical protein